MSPYTKAALRRYLRAGREDMRRVEPGGPWTFEDGGIPFRCTDDELAEAREDHERQQASSKGLMSLLWEEGTPRLL